MKYLLDSHAVDWVRHADSRLSIKARELIEASVRGDLAISDVSITELGRHLIAGKIKLSIPPLEWLEAAIAGIVVLPVTPAIALRAASLDWKHRDPCDRHIVATARRAQIAAAHHRRENPPPRRRARVEGRVVIRPCGEARGGQFG